MQPRLNILGRKHKIVQISYSPIKEGLVDSVLYEALSEETQEVTFKYVHDVESKFEHGEKVQNLASLIEYEGPTQLDKLFSYLEDVYVDETLKLKDLAVEMAETKAELPFDNVGHLLVQKQNEYFLMQQRVLGIEDTISEAHEFCEREFSYETDI